MRVTPLKERPSFLHCFKEAERTFPWIRMSQLATNVYTHDSDSDEESRTDCTPTFTFDKNGGAAENSTVESFFSEVNLPLHTVKNEVFCYTFKGVITPTNAKLLYGVV